MLLNAMRLKVPELIRHSDDNFRPKASNYSIVLWTLLRPKASNLRLKVIILWAQNFYYIIYWKLFITLYLYIDDLCIYSLVFINKAYRLYINI